MAVLSAPGPVSQVLQLAGVDKAIPCFDDAARARGALARGLAFAILIFALAGPLLVKEQHAPLSDVAVIVTDRHAPADTGVLAKSASGALEIVPLMRAVNLARTMEQLKEAGFWLYGLDERGDAPIGSLDLAGRVCIVLGAEGEGLRRLTAEKCDRLVTIPTNAALAALNVSNAAAVAAYEWARRRL